MRVTDTWDQVQPRLEKYEEYKAVESDEVRESAFDKVIRRLKEKEEDAEKDREMRDRDRSRRDYDRGDRDYRSSRGERRGGSRVSRTPEPDAYEADRRRAQADRERSYRKVSGLSPPRDRRDDRDRDRDRDRYRERERDRDRDYDRRSIRDYDRREDERERLYRTRGDPRGGRDELDYGGDARSTGSADRRRRRESDSESVASRSAKRFRRDSRERDRSKAPRRDRGREHSAVPEESVKQDEKAIHSGSEEGEIEED